MFVMIMFVFFHEVVEMVKVFETVCSNSQQLFIGKAGGRQAVNAFNAEFIRDHKYCRTC